MALYQEVVGVKMRLWGAVSLFALLWATIIIMIILNEITYISGTANFILFTTLYVYPSMIVFNYSLDDNYTQIKNIANKIIIGLPLIIGVIGFIVFAYYGATHFFPKLF